MAEKTDINAGAVTFTGIAILLATVVLTCLLWFFFEYMRRIDAADLKPRESLAPVFGTIREPVLQTSPRLDMEAMRLEENRILNGGDGRIPVDDAIRRVAETGVPKAAQAPAGMQVYRPQAGSRETGYEPRVTPEPTPGGARQ